MNSPKLHGVYIVNDSSAIFTIEFVFIAHETTLNSAVAVNSVDISQTAVTYGSDASNTVTINQNALADAETTATASLNKAAIKQSQANLGVQIGKWNDMSQKNRADAEIENVAVAKAKAFTMNYEEIIGNGNIVVPDINTQKATSSAALIDVQIKQKQKNLGLQVGVNNFLDQKNKGEAEAEQMAFNDLHTLTDISVKQKEGNLALQVGTMGFK